MEQAKRAALPGSARCNWLNKPQRCRVFKTAARFPIKHTRKADDCEPKLSDSYHAQYVIRSTKICSR
jgi:hypothetical protein